MRLLLSLFLAAMITQGSGSTRVMVQDFEKATPCSQPCGS